MWRKGSAKCGERSGLSEEATTSEMKWTIEVVAAERAHRQLPPPPNLNIVATHVS
jgi:hypothetical protein